MQNCFKKREDINKRVLLSEKCPLNVLSECEMDSIGLKYE